MAIVPRLYLENATKAFRNFLFKLISGGPEAGIAELPSTMLKIAYHSKYVLPLPPGHRFPMEKYELVHQQLLHEGTCSEENFFEPPYPDESDILSVHDKFYVASVMNRTLTYKQVRDIGLPLSERLVERELLIASGTIKAAAYALQHRIAMNIAGGTHHATSSKGEGFCIFNDQAVAASWLLRNRLAKQILIVDLDVHQGNGTAEIFSDIKEVFTFSMHGKNNYPFEKARSDLDIEFDDGTKDEAYLSCLKETLPGLIKEVRPDFVFYLSGVDILKTDKLGKLACSKWGCKERDRFVLQVCHDLKIPLEVSMGGGYSEHVKDIVHAHSNTFRLAKEIFF